jgi:hypothetical protein
MIDAGAAIEAAYSNTVPAIVLILLFAAIIFTGLLVGHSFGRAGRRHILTPVVFRIARHARGISNPGSRPPAKRSDPGKLRSVGKLASDNATRVVHRGISDPLVSYLVDKKRSVRGLRRREVWSRHLFKVVPKSDASWGPAVAHARQLNESNAPSRCGTRWPLRTLHATNRCFQKTSRRGAAAMKHRERTIRFAARSCGYSSLS